MMKYTTYLTIETDDGKYKLSALYRIKKDEFFGVSLEVPEEVSNTRHWDSDNYLIERFLPFLKGDNTDPDIDIFNKISKIDRKALRGIFKKGIKIGMFEEYFKGKEYYERIDTTE